MSLVSKIDKREPSFKSNTVVPFKALKGILVDKIRINQ